MWIGTLNGLQRYDGAQVGFFDTKKFVYTEASIAPKDSATQRAVTVLRHFLEQHFHFSHNFRILRIIRQVF